MGLIELLKAEMTLTLSDILRRKVLIFLFIAYPYILTLFIVLLGSTMGSYAAFKARFGIDPVPFFLTASYLMMSVLAVMDEVLWRPVHDGMIGTLPYIMSAPVSKLLYFSVVPFPRLLLSLILGTTTVLPVFALYYGVTGIYTTLIVVASSLVASLLFITFSILCLGTFYYLLGENWRLLNIIRPVILVLTGIYYPRFLMPVVLKLVATALPPSCITELLYRELLSIPTTLQYALILVGVATAISVIYAPLASLAVRSWEVKNLVRGGFK